MADSEFSRPKHNGGVCRRCKKAKGEVTVLIATREGQSTGKYIGGRSRFLCRPCAHAIFEIFEKEMT